ncbi:MAG: hypothetical protein FJW34_21205 [Acidobacteria bacterium]|nr:hypothetical protein [Acidobacteriota bacterium]
MRKRQLAAHLARRAHLSRPDAADQLDRVVHAILKSLRKGQAVRFPGLGVFLPGKTPTFRFDSEEAADKPADGSR